MKRYASASDPLWYKDAIIYELHVKAFADSNADGIGDFQGLMQKLDYLQDLGVTCIWLLPFFPSPLRDDGYDIADYMNVNPHYGTMDDFKAFLDAAHQRDLQVMIELVINHTSDQHPWFQAARTAPPGSPERDFYVWSDTDQLYKDARIIFTDTEKSNWTWDPVAKAYYWHRFFSHQPDLNFDNPRVLEEVLKAMRFWLDLGVDALRLDAIPYLVERDGTNCENLPETHAVIKKIRAAIDADYANRMMLAEANQWPEDVRPYFGAGDECHMAFHFPVMPRIYMALRQEDRLPITDIMVHTPDIPETCQWGLFLRNHDELTLEMVTHDERDYMYAAYSADPRMRINIGIRRRLAPLVDNNRRRIELLNSLLFSLPGTPIIYYGDEIGMGDNIYLGDRNGVRTPMQWNADRNAGFSRANPQMLYSPLIMDPVWGYQAINVEAQQNDPSSLLSWMRNMIALRKLFRLFGRGTLRFLNPVNRKVLAYLRQYEGEQVLCVCNLSRFAQPVDLDLSELAGMSPVEMLGYVDFPVITREPYRLTLSAYGFIWLELHGQPEPAAAPAQSEGIEMKSYAAWSDLLSGAVLERLETAVLPEWLPSQRWFGAKSRKISHTRITDYAEFDDTAITFVEVSYQDGSGEIYFLPLAVSSESSPGVLTTVKTDAGEKYLQDGFYDDRFCRGMLELIAESREIRSSAGSIIGHGGKLLPELRGPEAETLAIRRGSAEQSNSSIIFGSRLILKLFRKQHPGPNPDVEIGRFLTECAGFKGTPPFGGSAQYRPASGACSELAILQGLVRHEGDGWEWTLEELNRYFETCARGEFPKTEEPPAGLMDHWDQPVSPVVKDCVGSYFDAAVTLGRRTGALHAALADSHGDPDFEPEPFTRSDAEAASAAWREQAARRFELLKANVSRLPDDSVEMAGMVLARRTKILDRVRLSGGRDYGRRLRIHGDFHLGQVLRVRGDFVILDFEGEPARALEERRAKASPLKDVAGMLRSFSYAANSALMAYVARHSDELSMLEPWSRLWERSAANGFLKGYREATEKADFLPADAEDFRRMLESLLLDKALYELEYELNNRPTWVRIPLAGILTISS